jgi:hypothetical protein
MVKKKVTALVIRCRNACGGGLCHVNQYLHANVDDADKQVMHESSQSTLSVSACPYAYYEDGKNDYFSLLENCAYQCNVVSSNA